MKDFKKIILIAMMLIAFMVVLVACNGDDSGDNNSVTFDETIETAMTTVERVRSMFSVNGMTIALVDAERDFTWTHGFGYADSQNDLPVTEDTMFGIASISKAFTAIAVMQLVEEGLIDLDEPIVTYLPEFSMLPNPVEGGNYENITVRMLLTHTSGIYPDFWGNHVLTTVTHDERFLNNLLDSLSEQIMISEEGTVFTYANSGYNLLGILVATVLGYENVFEGFVSYTNEHIFSPANMTRSTFAMDDAKLPYLARPYANATIQEEEIILHNGPTGGMFSTAADMATFMHIILNGGQFEEGQLLSEETFVQMLRVHDFDFSQPLGGITYGLGFMQRMNFEGVSSVGHNGMLTHYHSDMMFDLESGIGVFVSVNSATGAAAVAMVADAVFQSAIYEKTGELNIAPTLVDPDATEIELSREELQLYEGFYVLAGGQLGTVELAENDTLIFYQHSMPQMPMGLIPMSDGSFTNPFIGHLWFDEVGGEMALFQSEFKILIGLRMEVDSFLINESLTPWFGTYYFVPESERQFPIVTHIEIGVDEFDIAVVELFFPHMNQVAPLFELDGVWHFDGVPLEFTIDIDGVASVEALGMRFERANSD